MTDDALALGGARLLGMEEAGGVLRGQRLTACRRWTARRPELVRFPRPLRGKAGSPSGDHMPGGSSNAVARAPGTTGVR